MLNKLFKTDSKDYISLITRLVIGFVMLPHGAQKLLGWFGGYGFSGTLNFFTGTLGIPFIISLIVILTESIGSILLILGFAGRLSSLLLISTMIGAVATSHLSNGFFMNWFGNQAGEGFEYHILYSALAFIVLIKGSGMFSIDILLQDRMVYRKEFKTA
ncbi:MAG: DoxX family protein [Bacteroidetes bacterium]|nr:DoxX family protein [Bacteroidota bacterium]